MNLGNPNVNLTATFSFPISENWHARKARATILSEAGTLNTYIPNCPLSKNEPNGRDVQLKMRGPNPFPFP